MSVWGLKTRALVILSVLPLIAGCVAGRGQVRELPAPAPSMRVTLQEDGSQRAIKEFLGRKVVIGFWATWCSRSKSFINEFNDYAKSQKGKEKAVFIAINLDDDDAYDEVSAFLDERELKALIHAFSGNAEYDEAYVQLGNGRLPEITVVDPEGMIIFQGRSIEELKVVELSQEP